MSKPARSPSKKPKNKQQQAKRVAKVSNAEESPVLTFFQKELGTNGSPTIRKIKDVHNRLVTYLGKENIPVSELELQQMVNQPIPTLLTIASRQLNQSRSQRTSPIPLQTKTTSSSANDVVSCKQTIERQRKQRDHLLETWFEYCEEWGEVASECGSLTSLKLSPTVNGILGAQFAWVLYLEIGAAHILAHLVQDHGKFNSDQGCESVSVIFGRAERCFQWMQQNLKSNGGGGGSNDRFRNSKYCLETLKKLYKRLKHAHDYCSNSSRELSSADWWNLQNHLRSSKGNIPQNRHKLSPFVEQYLDDFVLQCKWRSKITDIRNLKNAFQSVSEPQLLDQHSKRALRDVHMYLSRRRQVFRTIISEEVWNNTMSEVELMIDNLPPEESTKIDFSKTWDWDLNHLLIH